MKKQFLNVVLFAFAINSFYSATYKSLYSVENEILASKYSSKYNNDEVIEKTYNITFKSIRVSTGLKSEVYKSDKDRIVVYAPADLMNYVKVEKKGEDVQLVIRSEKFKKISTDRIIIKIYAKDINNISASSSGSIELKDSFSSPNFNVSVSSAGKIKGNLKGSNFKIKASSSGTYSGEIIAKNIEIAGSSAGEIIISGKSQKAHISASSSATVNAKNFITEIASVSASSSGDVTIGVAKSLTASASSSGDINVIKKGTLNHISQSKTSFGSISIQ